MGYKPQLQTNRHVLSATLGTNEAWAISHNCKKLGMGYQPQLGTMRHACVPVYVYPHGSNTPWADARNNNNNMNNNKNNNMNHG